MNPLRLLSGLAPIVAGLLVPALGQEQPPSVARLELRIRERTPILGMAATGGIDPIRCDASGSVYFRPASGKETFLGGPVIRIPKDGTRLVSFELSIPELADAKKVILQDYTVNAKGEVIELVSFQSKDSRPSIAMIVFNADGHYSSYTPISSSFSARQIALFQSGELLLSGVWLDSDKGEGAEQQNKIAKRPFTGIFGKNGQLIKEIRLPGDVSFGSPDESGKAGTPPPASASPSYAIDLSRALTGTDGNVYLLRNGPKPTVYVLSQGGEVIRRINIPLPPNQDNNPSMFLSNGRLAFDVFEPVSPNSPNMRMTIIVVDAQTGEKLWEYVPAPDLFGIAACYNGNEFTFLSAIDKNQLALVRVSP